MDVVPLKRYLALSVWSVQIPTVVCVEGSAWC